MLPSSSSKTPAYAVDSLFRWYCGALSIQCHIEALTVPPAGLPVPHLSPIIENPPPTVNTPLHVIGAMIATMRTMMTVIGMMQHVIRMMLIGIGSFWYCMITSTLWAKDPPAASKVGGWRKRTRPEGPTQVISSCFAWLCLLPMLLTVATHWHPWSWPHQHWKQPNVLTHVIYP